MEKQFIITLSDKGYRGEREDKSGPLICEMLPEDSYSIEERLLLPDEQEMIEKELIRLCDDDHMDHNTHHRNRICQQDCAPEACRPWLRNAQGISDAMRYCSIQVTPRAMLSRGVSVIRGKTLIINLPGSTKAVRENLSFILSSLEHGLGILTGRDGECGGA